MLHFTVDWSPEVHRLSDGRYLRRVNDANMPFPAEQIAALKQTKAQGIVERSFPPGATLDDLDLDLVTSLLPKMHVDGPPQAFLQKRRLVEDHHGRLVPCLAALLLFGKEPLRWQEALVNAVAHRDYSIQGASVEVWMFDDHMEIRSPRPPPRPVTAAGLNRRERLHVSRNPMIVRVLTELDYMRELGEGIPRMFDEMEREGFYPPHFDDLGGTWLQVTLRNQPVYDRATLEWLQQFEGSDLSGDQKRLLAYAHAHGNHFTSRDYRKLTGLNIYDASNSIKSLIRKGIVRLTGKGSRVYKIVEAPEIPEQIPEELYRLVKQLGQTEAITNQKVREVLGLTRITAARYLSRWVEAGWLQRVGKTGRKSRYKPTSQLNVSLSKCINSK